MDDTSVGLAPAALGHVIFTVGGNTVDLFHPQPSAIDINDIAAGLSKICRFSGQLSRFYSVAEHSVLVAKLMYLRYGEENPSVLLLGLLHDASEAYLGDVTRPIKNVLKIYKALESRMERAIATRFHLPSDDNAWGLVKPCDNAVCRLEAEKLVNADSDKWDWGDVEAADLDLNCYYPEDAEDEFLESFAMINNGTVGRFWP